MGVSRGVAHPQGLFWTWVGGGAGVGSCPVFVAGAGAAPLKVHWGYPDPSNAEGGDEGKRRAFELTRQAIGYRMLQLLALPLGTLERDALRDALLSIGRS